MLNIDKYFLYSFIFVSILFSSFIIENIDAQEVQLREGDKIIVKLYSSNFWTIRISAYDYIVRLGRTVAPNTVRIKNKHNILAEIGIAFSK